MPMLHHCDLKIKGMILLEQAIDHASTHAGPWIILSYQYAKDKNIDGKLYVECLVEQLGNGAARVHTTEYGSTWLTHKRA